jgi:hypothetical protein
MPPDLHGRGFRQEQCWRSLGTVADATRDTIVLAAGYVLIMLAIRRLRRRDPVAYGVFILLGALLAIATEPGA